MAGSLCADPNGEFFVVAYDAFEVIGAEKTMVSLAYSGESWTRIQNIIQARQKSQPHYKLIGQAHGHNFLPNDGNCCEACPTREYCDLTNLFASADDQEFTRAVFSQQPWSLCLIFGLSARGDLIRGLFTLHDGKLGMREFRLLPDFDPTQYDTITTD